MLDDVVRSCDSSVGIATRLSQRHPRNRGVTTEQEEKYTASAF